MLASKCKLPKPVSDGVRVEERIIYLILPCLKDLADKAVKPLSDLIGSAQVTSVL